ncbi:hypothetical protein Ae168Ps1_5449c [Pseudonocardia sp. Ae168_Ps1]|nr:hypothetical protein Ae168Ps1_5449c [Pseudonocardia sp. Ae168_Ps1]OLL91594.1 hypothetical protein Ae356Ps1_1491 [Pseudonocardia sp. Ae356_Ps1]
MPTGPRTPDGPGTVSGSSRGVRWRTLSVIVPDNPV